MPACALCHGRSYVVEPGSRICAARVCSCSTPCPRCGGTGHSLVTQESTFSERVGKRSYEVFVPCHCRLLARRVEWFNQTELPRVYAQATFDSWSTAAPRPDVVESLERARGLAQRFAFGYSRERPSRGFILSGPVGAGKTHLLAAALTHLTLEMGVRTRYQEISLLYAFIRRGFQLGKSGGEIIEPLCEVEILAIDELGKGRGSQFEHETLDELIARRYNAGRTTLFATNYPLDAERRPVRSVGGYRTSEDAKAQAKEAELLRDRVGERIYSRLCEMCDFVELPAHTPDHRQARSSGRLRV